MINWTMNLCVKAWELSPTVPAALVVASLNLLVQLFFSVCFGADHVPKLRGDRS